MDEHKIISEYAKTKSNFKEIRDRAEYHASRLQLVFDEEKYNTIKVNLQLINGELDVKEFYDNPLQVGIGGDTIQLDYQDITHIPLLGQVCNTYIGEVMKLGVVYNMKDEAPTRSTIIKNKVNEDTASILSQMMDSQKQKAVLKVMQDYNITDPFETPEIQQQVGQEVEKIMQFKSTKDVQEFLKNRITTPKLRSAQAILRKLTMENKVKEEQIQGLKYILASGELYFYCDVENEDILYETVNPMFLEWEGSLEQEDIQKSRVVKRTMWLTRDDVIQKYSEWLTKEDLDKLEYYYEPVGTPSNFKNKYEDQRTKEFMHIMSQDQNIEKIRAADINTHQGREMFRQYQEDIFQEQGIHRGIRISHIVFREKTKLKKVTRLTEGLKEVFWVSEEKYRKNPLDISVVTVVTDKVWETTIIGNGVDSFHVKTRPFPYQYVDPKNPYKINFPYVGKKIGTNKGVTNPFIFVNLGKSSQKDFDVTIAAVKHAMMTNMGSVFTFIMNYKPDNISWQEFVDSIRNLKIMPIDSSKAKGDPNAASLFREISMGSTQDIAGLLQIADKHQAFLYTSMLFNQERVGAINQYQTSSNKDSSVSSSYNQTTWLTQEYLSIVNASLNLLLNTGYHFYKERPEKAAEILDDVSYVDFIQSSPLGYYYKGLSVVNSYEDIDLLKQIKSYSLAFIQNSDNYISIIDLILSKTEGEIREILEQETIRRQEMMLENRQHETQLKDMEVKGTIERETIKNKALFDIETMKQDKSMERAFITRENFALANDIDKDGQADFLTSKLAELENKIELKEIDREIEMEKLRVKNEYERSRNTKK